MSKQATFMKFFASHGEAFEYMKRKNLAARGAGDKDTTYCVVDGPDDDYAVVDLDTAIDHGQPYEWAFGWQCGKPKPQIKRRIK